MASRPAGPAKLLYVVALVLGTAWFVTSLLAFLEVVGDARLASTVLGGGTMTCLVAGLIIWHQQSSASE